MSSVLLILLALAVLAGVSFAISRRRLPPIERGIRDFSREMQALAPRHPSEGPPRNRATPVEDSSEVQPPAPDADPSVDDQPEPEA